MTQSNLDIERSLDALSKMPKTHNLPLQYPYTVLKKRGDRLLHKPCETVFDALKLIDHNSDFQGDYIGVWNTVTGSFLHMEIITEGDKLMLKDIISQFKN